MGGIPVFFHPDCTVGTGISPVQLALADFTAGRELHPALKTLVFHLFAILLYIFGKVLQSLFFLQKIWYTEEPKNDWERKPFPVFIVYIIVKGGSYDLCVYGAPASQTAVADR